MSAASSGFNFDRITTDLLDEINIVEAALATFPDFGSNQPN